MVNRLPTFLRTHDLRSDFDDREDREDPFERLNELACEDYDLIPTEREELLDRYLSIPVTRETDKERRAALDALNAIGGLLPAGAA